MSDRRSAAQRHGVADPPGELPVAMLSLDSTANAYLIETHKAVGLRI
jgi:hypothetical protein